MVLRPENYFHFRIKKRSHKKRLKQEHFNENKVPNWHFIPRHHNINPWQNITKIVCLYSSSVPLAIVAYPFLSDLLASHPSKHLSFVSLSFPFVLFPFPFFYIFYGLPGTLFCWVIVPGTLAL